jgi:hypothetical protein
MMTIALKESLLCSGGLGNHYSHMFEAGAMNSAEAEYNEAIMTCMATHHVKETLNHIQEVKDESKVRNIRQHIHGNIHCGRYHLVQVYTR